MGELGYPAMVINFGTTRRNEDRIDNVFVMLDERVLH
jgi:hypothetical protein